MAACLVQRQVPAKRVLGLNVHSLTEPELEELILRSAVEGDGFVATYATAYSLASTRKNPNFCRALNSCDVCYPDGWGVAFASLLLGNGTMPKTTANRYFLRLCNRATRAGLSIALLGGRPGVAAKVASRIREMNEHAQLWVVDGYSFGSKEDFEDLDTFQPNLLFVAMGQPKQESVALDLRKMLPRSVIVCVGGLFDFIAGAVPRCPEPVRAAGMEWAFRLVTRPQQVWRRYVIGLPKLGAMVAVARVKSVVISKH
jgi:N-acetylglucosaminyldiphosphoundecaprenol N-acetyl-beta-D-mannosaminyltransferase